MLFLGRVAGVVVATLPILVGRIGKTAPCPEVAAGKEAAVLTLLADKVEHILIIFITGGGRHIFGKLEAVAREAELLQDDGLAVLQGHFHVVVDTAWCSPWREAAAR